MNTDPGSRGGQIEFAVSRIAVGGQLAAAVVLAFGLGAFAVALPGYARPVLGVLAWVLLLATGVAQQRLTSRLTGPRGWRLPGLLVLLAAIVALDVVGAWGSPDAYPTAAVSTSAALLMAATVWGAPTIAAATAGLVAVLAAAYFAQPAAGTIGAGAGMAMLAIVVAPQTVGVLIIRAFRRLVRDEAERAQAGAAASAPGTALGPFASAELAQLDHDAERLLDGVATGRIRVPLDRESAAGAAAIAAELRAHLIAGKRASWLAHAVEESSLLGSRVELTDPQGLAALLSPAQRDGLLSALWLVAGGRPRGAGDLRVAIDAAGHRAASRLVVPIALDLDGVHRGGVDGAVWKALDRVGRHGVHASAGGLRVEIDAPVADDVGEGQ